MNNTPTKWISVGVTKARMPFVILSVEKPVATVIATNRRPMRAPADCAAVTKKLSHLWSIFKDWEAVRLPILRNYLLRRVAEFAVDASR